MSVQVNIEMWGISTVGSALHWQCRGHRFESGMLHMPRTLVNQGFFLLSFEGDYILKSMICVT